MPHSPAGGIDFDPSGNLHSEAPSVVAEDSVSFNMFVVNGLDSIVLADGHPKEQRGN
jgi:hypothetical protein